MGRRREASEITRLMASARMVTLTGVGGIGKTRLSLRVATDVWQEYPDGAWLVELAALEDPELLVRTVAAALGLDDLSPTSDVGRLLDYLMDRKLLLVLDHCDHLLDACAALVGKLLPELPGLSVLATSQQVLSVENERAFPVQSLAVPHPDKLPSVDDMNRYDAVLLFVERAAAVLPGFEVDQDNRMAVARLCQWLDGIPLAIELAAVRLRSLSVEKVFDRLVNRFQLLGGSRTNLPEQRLWGAIDWSYDLCSRQEQILWSRLSVFAGGFDLQAAVEVCAGDGIDRQDLFDLVAGLVDKSVLVREGAGGGLWERPPEGQGVRARYGMFQSVRRFGRDRLTAAGETLVVRARHRDYYKRLAAQAEAQWFSHRQVEWLVRLHHEYANLRVALGFCLDQPGQARDALEIAGALHSFWMGSGFAGEGRRALERALQRDPEPTPARAKALWVAGSLALLPGDVDAAVTLLEESQTLTRSLGDDAALTYAIQYSGMASLSRGDLTGAYRALQTALERHRAAGDLDGVSVTLDQMLSVASILGDPKAVALGEEALFLCETHGAQWSRSYVLWSVGLRKWRHGERGQGISLVRKALQLKRLFSDPWGTGLCIEVLAWAATADSQDERAARLLGACHAAWQMTGMPCSLAPEDLAFHDQCEAQARRELGADRFAAVFGEGAHLSLNEAISYALDWYPDPG